MTQRGQHQTDAMQATLPLFAAKLQAAMEQPSAYAWQIIQFEDCLPTKISPNSPKIIVPATIRLPDVTKPASNLFDSRTAALRASEKCSRQHREIEGGICRTEKGHWGCWMWQHPGKPTMRQSVRPILRTELAKAAKPAKPASTHAAPVEPAQADTITIAGE